MINLMYIVFIALLGLGIHETETASPGDKGQAKTTPVGLAPEAMPQGSDSLSRRAVGANERSLYVARVIPRSRQVVKGGRYEAELRLVREEAVPRGQIVVRGQSLGAGEMLYRAFAGEVGRHHYQGYIELPDAEGQLQQFPFEDSYEVVEPTIAIAPTLMNVLYAGIDNALDISVAGLSPESLRVEMSGGVLRRVGHTWLARPSQTEGEATIRLATLLPTGELLPLGERKLRIRPLPPPTPYLALSTGDGGRVRFRGGRVSRSQVLACKGLSAAVDDGILDIEFAVLSFQLISFDALGNAIPEVSDGAKFSERQERLLRDVPRGKRLYITEIKAKGQDGITHRLPPIELIIH